MFFCDPETVLGGIVCGFFSAALTCLMADKLPLIFSKQLAHILMLWPHEPLLKKNFTKSTSSLIRSCVIITFLRGPQLYFEAKAGQNNTVAVFNAGCFTLNSCFF